MYMAGPTHVQNANLTHELTGVDLWWTGIVPSNVCINNRWRTHTWYMNDACHTAISLHNQNDMLYMILAPTGLVVGSF